MSDFLLTLLRLFIIFGRNTVGCLNRPYVTCRKLSEEKTDIRQIVFIFFLAGSYFAFASLIRTGVKNPYLLTIKFNSLLMGGTVGFLGMIFFLFITGKVMRIKVRLSTLSVLWAYSLLPTILWFFFTSFMYLILPPPRTLSVLGKLYSIFFIAFSFVLFFWKMILYYLTLRFGLRLDLVRILFTTLILAPLVGSYSLLMYNLGIFRIPFI